MSRVIRRAANKASAPVESVTQTVVPVVKRVPRATKKAIIEAPVEPQTPTIEQNNDPAPQRRLARQADWRKHILARGMWAGSNALMQQELFLTNASGTHLAMVVYHPLLWKIIDEIIVNAVDQHILFPTQTTAISINFTNGWIEVSNVGPGIPVELTTNQQGAQMYQPQLMFTELMSGSNFDDLEDHASPAAAPTERIVGGQNGIGAKLTVAWSTEFMVDTCDAHTAKRYVQTYKSNLQEIGEPKITALGRKAPGTTIRFLPDYQRIGIIGFVPEATGFVAGQVAGQNEVPMPPKTTAARRRAAQKFADTIEYSNFAPTLAALLETRAYQVAAYAAPNLTVKFNGAVCRVPQFSTFCAGLKPMSQHVASYTVAMRPTSETQKKYSIDVCFAVSDGQPRQISFVNGIYTYDGGSLIRAICGMLTAQTKKYVERQLSKFGGQQFSKTFIQNNAMIIVRAQVPDPEFTSQTKSVLSGPGEAYFSDYTLSDAEWKRVWDVYEPVVQSSIVAQQMGGEKTRTTKKMKADKYREANNCGKRGASCGLFLCEGDSAIGTINTALLADLSPTFSYDTYGYYSVQGVIVNALKESTELAPAATPTKPKRRGAKQVAAGQPVAEPPTQELPAAALPAIQNIARRIPGAKLLNSERIATLIKILNLDFNKTYAEGPEGDAEFETLRYKYVVILTDQDLDGFNISSLIVVLFTAFWPALIARRFIRRIFTPLLRFYPKNAYRASLEVQGFYSKADAQRWITERGAAWVASHYEDAKYYKGLGQHAAAYGEVDDMFSDADSRTSVLTMDAAAIKTMHIYYANDTAPRKEALATPVTHEPEFAPERPLSEQFHVDTKLYQRDNIVRKLLCAMDGFVASRRKVFYGLRQLPRRDIRVVALAGEIINKYNYHHGEQSLHDTIIRMAQAYPAARNLPLLLPLGNFGSRAKGYQNFAAPRYIDTRLNWRLADALFKVEDEWLLDYVLEEGRRYEPVHYCPVIPYVLCETNQIPATGWNMFIVARDVSSIISEVRRGIAHLEKGDANALFKCAPLPMWRKDFHGTIRRVGARDYSVGSYTVNQVTETITITEIPFQTMSDTIRANIEAYDFVDEVLDNTTTERGVNIIVKLKPGALATIAERFGKPAFDCFEDCFGLYDAMYDRINLVDAGGNVIEYANYEDVFDDWFDYRATLYVSRIERELVVRKAKLTMLEAQQRFAAEHIGMHITSAMSEEQITAAIRGAQPPYPELNSALINNPRFESVAQLKILMYQGSYDYLLDMSYKRLSARASEERQAEIEKIKARILWLETDPRGLKTWAVELDELEHQINAGLESSWFYGENQYLRRGSKPKPAAAKPPARRGRRPAQQS